MSNTMTLGKVSLVPKGVYDATVPYKVYDIVFYNGNSYIVIQDCTGVSPPNPAYYVIFCAQGTAGLNGTDGVSFVISGFYATLADVELNVIAPEPGDAYAVGITEPYTIYIYDGISHDWIDSGEIDGVPGLNVITSETAINLTGLLKGDAGHFAEAIKNTDYAQAVVDIPVTATVAGWVGDASPYTYAFEVAGVSANSKVQVGLAETVTAEQYNDASFARIQAAPCTANTVNIRAFGTKPSMNLPILIRVGG